MFHAEIMCLNAYLMQLKEKSGKSFFHPVTRPQHSLHPPSLGPGSGQNNVHSLQHLKGAGSARLELTVSIMMRPGHWAPESWRASGLPKGQPRPPAPGPHPSPGDLTPPASPSSQAANPSGSTLSSHWTPSAPRVLMLGLPAPWASLPA